MPPGPDDPPRSERDALAGVARLRSAVTVLFACYVLIVEPSDLTVRVLQEIREEIRGLRQDQQGLGTRMDDRFARMDERFDAISRENAARFEVIETTLRDLAQQLVLLARGVKAAIERRDRTDERLDDIERRLAEIEKRSAT
jgi:hypothetical protein